MNVISSMVTRGIKLLRKTQSEEALCNKGEENLTADLSHTLHAGGVGSFFFLKNLWI